jgi:release factor glutamine methyltransferase
MSPPEAWTIGRLLTWTTDYLKQHGSESPRLDAEVLLAHARGCSRIELYTAFESVVDDAVRATFRDLVRRRAASEPVAYLVGYREFYSLPFYVTPAVLIPRPETEHLVVAALERIQHHPPGQRPFEIVDVGTGSGAIAVALAKHAPACRVTATDASAAALAVARRNVERHAVSDRVALVESDLLSGLPAAQTFDFVVSNPPYVSEAEWARLPATVKDHEPRLALVGGANGCAVIERLVSQAVPRLTPGGWLVLEISPQIEGAVRQIVTSAGGFDAVQTAKDLAGLARVICARRT